METLNKIINNMLETLQDNWKRYLVSSLVTFLATFLLVAIPQLLDDTFVWSQGAISGVVLAAVRLGVKAVWETLEPVIADIRS
jgi:hypothetical protein